MPRPRVIVHVAVSLDGKIEDFDPGVTTYYDLIRPWDEEATLCGSETILAAAPDPDPPDSATPVAGPDAADPHPLLAVIDSRGRLRSWAGLLRAGHWSAGLAFCSETTPSEHLDYLDRLKVEAVLAGDERVDFERALDALAERDVATVRIDAGPTLIGLALRAGLVDELSLLVHPAVSGSGRAFVDCLDASVHLRLVASSTRGAGLAWLRYEVEG